MSSQDDRDWTRSLIEELEGPLVRYAARITHDVERARDVVQDVFVKLIAADRAAIDSHVKEWLFTVCRNRAIDVCRKEGRMTTTDETGFAGLAATEPGPERRLVTQENVGRAMALLDTLPPRQQECIRLKFQDGLSYKEISRITSHSVSYVGVLIHHGMKTLRASFAPTGTEA